MASQVSEESRETQDYVQALGLTSDYIEGVSSAVMRGDLELKQVAGFTAPELDALYGEAMNLIRRGAYSRGGKVFLFLAQLDRRDPRYYRGLGLAFHSLREFGWANGCYNIAIELGHDDRIAMALRAECTLYLRGKRAAHAALSEVLALGPRSVDDQPYLDRASQVLAKIRL